MARLALVTGGGRGIGAEICRVFAAGGLRVVAADLDKEAASSTAELLGGQGHSGQYVDVADEGSVEALFDAAERDAGPVAILVCNAGRLLLRDGKRPLIQDTTLQNWNDTFAVNTVGTFPAPEHTLRGGSARGARTAHRLFVRSRSARGL